MLTFLAHYVSFFAFYAFQFWEQALSSAVRNLFRQIYAQRSINNLLGNGSRRDSAKGVTANYIKIESIAKIRGARLPICTSDYVTKSVLMGGEIVELVE
jgi:hypothetical protein